MGLDGLARRFEAFVVQLKITPSSLAARVWAAGDSLSSGRMPGWPRFTILCIWRSEGGLSGQDRLISALCRPHSTSSWPECTPNPLLLAKRRPLTRLFVSRHEMWCKAVPSDRVLPAYPTPSSPSCRTPPRPPGGPAPRRPAPRAGARARSRAAGSWGR